MQPPQVNNQHRFRKEKPAMDLSNLVFGKVPPQSKELEEAVLGAVLLESKYGAFEQVSEILQAECFYVEAHQQIFSAMVKLAAKNQPIDLLTVVERLQVDGKLESIGGPYRLSKLTNGVVSSANIEAHARIVVQKFICREMIRITGEIMANAYDEKFDVFDMLDQAENNILSVRMRNIRQQYKKLHDVAKENIIRLEELRQRDETVTGIASGFDELDMVTCGWQDTDLIILAARPSVGKTAFALTLAKNACIALRERYLQDRKINQQAVLGGVAVFSLEMADRQLVNRVLSSDSGVWLWKFKNGKINDDEMKSIYRATEALVDVNIFVDDTAGLTINDFRTKAKMLVRKEGVRIIFIDYLQLMTAPHIKNREQEIAHISRELKKIAKELQVPIIALSQLSRDIEKTGKTAKREPQLSDIRESGAIEQDADAVMFLYRPTDAEIAEEAALKDIFYLKIAKHRNGSLETFIGKFTGIDQKHHYLKVVDAKTLQPSASNWKPINNSAVANSFYEPTTGSRFSGDDNDPEKLPF